MHVVRKTTFTELYKLFEGLLQIKLKESDLQTQIQESNGTKRCWGLFFLYLDQNI